MTPTLRRRRARRFLGLYRGLVADVDDPQQAGRVQVTLPSISGSSASWAATLRDVGGPPAVGDEVLVGFDAGDLSRPYVVGVVATATPQIELADDNGNLVRLTAAGIEITSSSTIRINASSIRVSAGLGQTDAGMWKFSGVVQADTLIANSVVASSYTPGAGNQL